MLSRIAQWSVVFVSAFAASGVQDARAAQAESFPAGQATEFARVTHTAEGQPLALQIAIARYVSKGGEQDVSVDLIGAVHVGDAAYYGDLNRRFREYDAVLFELVAPEGAYARVGDSERRGFISTAQMAMTRALGLSFQLDEIDYGRPNFVHADLSPSELAQSMADRDESLYVYFWRLLYASISEAAKDPLGIRAVRDISLALRSGQDNALKIAFAYEMTNVESVSGALDGPAGSALIDARNQRAIDVLEEQIESGARRIGIFYGVAHMPDFEERLIGQLSLEYDKTQWVDAWRLDAGPTNADAAGLE